MPELRKDYFTDRLALTNTERGNRGTGLRKGRAQDFGECFACKCVKSKKGPFVPFVIDHPQDLSAEVGASEKKQDKATAGNHLLIIASRDHGSSFQKLSVEEIMKLLSLAQENMKLQYGRKENNFVLLFSRYAHTPVSAVPHASLELLGLPDTAPLVAEEATAIERSLQDLGTCPICSVISVEQGGPRQIISTLNFVAFAPWAPTSAYEFWIYPKAHQTSFLRTAQREMNDLALILRSTLGGLHSALGDVPFNMVFHTIDDRRAGEYHWHIEVHPEWKGWGGVEKGLGVFLSDVSPEATGDILGRASRKELATLVGVL